MLFRSIRLEHPILGDFESRSFADVKLHRLNERNFVAQDCETGTVIPHPSREPYFVVFLSEEEYRESRDGILSRDVSPLELVGRKIRELRGFSFDGDDTSAPQHYSVAEIIEDIGSTEHPPS